jgi:hypothetical protein
MSHVPKHVVLHGKLYVLEIVLADRNLANTIYSDLRNGVKPNMKILTQFLFENLKRRDHLRDVGVDEWITLKCIFRNGRVWIRFICLTIETNGCLLYTFRLHKTEFLEQPSDCQLLNKNSGARSRTI